MAEWLKAAVLKTETRLSAILGFPHKSHTLKHIADRPTWLPVALEAPFGRAAGTIVGTAVPCTRRRCHAFALVPTLDDIRPERWEFDGELLNLLWVLDHTVDLQPPLATLLEKVLASELARKAGADFVSLKVFPRSVDRSTFMPKKGLQLDA